MATPSETARLETARAEAHRVEALVRSTVQAEYPGLMGYELPLPTHRIIHTGPGPDDWRWGGGRYGGYGSAAAHARAFERFCTRAVEVAAARISEAYGLGAGSEWAMRHFGAPGDESLAIAGHTGCL